MVSSWYEYVSGMDGQACITGTRIPVSVVLGCLADGMTRDEVLGEYASLTSAAVTAALAYAAWITAERPFPVDPQG